MPLELVVQHANRTRRHSLTEGEVIIGSSADCDVRIAHPTVSRRHARLRVENGRVQLEDLGSRNGTRIGARPLRARTRIAPGTVIAFGGVTALVEEIDEEDLEPALLLPALDSEPGDRPSAIVSGADILDAPTASVEPFDHFLRQSLPELLVLIREGASESRLVEHAGRALARVLPCLALEIADQRVSTQGKLFELGEAVPASRVHERRQIEVGDFRLTWLLPTQAQGDLFAPLGELALGLVGLARQRSKGGVRRRPAKRPEPPPMPAPASVEPAVQRLYADAARVAHSDLSVLIRGESGTGKEVLARYLHAASARRDGPLLALNCAALPQSLLEAELFGIERGVATGVDERPGTFERATGGTLFLDEVGDMALETQTKLLRALEVGELYRLGGRSPYPVDVRILSATNRDLPSMMAEGSFREDLYFRIADWEVELPPLRDRPADVPHLAGHFLARESQRLGRRIRGISRAAMKALERYHWPGNVRQLKKEMSRVALLVGAGELLDSARLDPAIAAAGARAPGLKAILKQAEAEHLAATLRACEGDRRATAERLGVSEITLYRRLKEHDLS